MHLNRKKILDYYLGAALFVVFKPLALILGRLLRRDHSLEVCGDILVIKLLGGGSIVIALPALLGIKRAYPDRKLKLLCTRQVAFFAETLGVFDEIVIIDDRSFFNLAWSGIKALRATFRIDTVLDFEAYSRLSTIFCLFTCARNRISFYLESVFWRRNISTHLVFFNRYSGTYHFYQEAAALLGAQRATMEECKAFIARAVMPEVSAQIPSQYRSGYRLVAIGHACSDLGAERMLNPEQWLEVFKRHLPEDQRCVLIFLGAARDAKLAEMIADRTVNCDNVQATLNLCGKLSLTESVSTLALCDLFLGIDSGLLHFARLLTKECISYWGPTDPTTRLQPVTGLIEQAFYEKIPCSPCVHVSETPPCQGNNICIKQIFNPTDVAGRQPFCIKSRSTIGKVHKGCTS